MVREVARLLFVFVFCGPNTQGLLLVHVGLADGHSDRENRYVHHDEVADLYCRVQISNVDYSETCSTS